MTMVGRFRAFAFALPLAIGVVFGCSVPSLEPASVSIEQKRLKSHVTALADDTMEGRGAGYPGELAAALYLEAAFAQLGLEPAGDPAGDGPSYLQVFSFHPSQPPDPWEVLESRNVLGLLPGTDPSAGLVVLGAHYDGQGRAGQADPGRLAGDGDGDGDDIWNSADDNASGVAVLLEVARVLALGDERASRSVLFAAFGAEEHSLAGSVHLANTLLASNRRPVAMVNLEKLGRVPGSPPLTASAGTSPELAAVTERANLATGLEVSSIVDGIVSDTDHFPFAVRGVPAIVIGTVNEDDIHQPADEVEKIDLPSLAMRASYVLAFVRDLVAGDDPLPFTGDPSPFLGVQCVPATAAELERVGIAAGGGLKVSAVIDDLPGARSGLLPGDLIESVGGEPMADDDDSWPALDDLVADAGTPAVGLGIVRDGERLAVSIRRAEGGE